MKSIKQKQYTKNRRIEFLKIFLIVTGMLLAITGLSIWGVRATNRAAERKQKIQDSIALADSIATADSIANIIVQDTTDVVDTTKNDTIKTDSTIIAKDTVKNTTCTYEGHVNDSTVKIRIKINT